MQSPAGGTHEVVVTVSNPHCPNPLPPVFLQFQLQPLGKIWFRVFPFPGRQSRHLQIDGAKRSGIAGCACQDIEYSPHRVVDAGTRAKLLAQLLAMPIEVASADAKVDNMGKPVRCAGFVLSDKSPSADKNVPAAVWTPRLSRGCALQGLLAVWAGRLPSEYRHCLTSASRAFATTPSPPSSCPPSCLPSAAPSSLAGEA
jgi:hypothetical protein